MYSTYTNNNITSLENIGTIESRRVDIRDANLSLSKLTLCVSL